MANNEESSLGSSRYLDGGIHIDWSEKRYYKNPTQGDIEAMELNPTGEVFRHRDIMSRITHKPRDLLRHIHPINCKPRRMLVQAAPEVYGDPQGDWRRTTLKGNAPTLLSVAAWALGPKKASYTSDDRWAIAARVFVTIPILIPYLLLPTGSATKKFIQPTYTPFAGRSWDYPKYSRNRLDASPAAPEEVTFTPRTRKATDEEPVAAAYKIIGEEHRQKKPRLLVVYQNGSWEIVVNSDQAYIFISYAARHFKGAGGLARLEDMAAKLARQGGVSAYWLDYKCIAKEQPTLTEDIHAIYDVVRGAHQVCVVLPDLGQKALDEWGERMWTLPEALLSSQQNLKFCCKDLSEERTKLALAANVWRDETCTRLLAEHYTGVLNLSRIELITVGLEALASRYGRDPDHIPFTEADIAYALMALVRHRPMMNPEDSLFQALARLSLANDSDGIVERMICLLPDISKAAQDSFILHDKLGAKLWDIEPLCQVAGVCNDREVILDGCRGISIRWKDIPEIAHRRHFAWKRFFAKMGVRSASLWFIVGIILISMGNAWSNKALSSDPSTSTADSSTADSSNGDSSNSNSSNGAFDNFFSGQTMLQAGIPMLLIGIGLLIYAPWAICTIYGGKIWGQSPWLVGFEGVLPIEDIERKTFGNYAGRLSYAPSSNVFSQRQPDERVGINPDWVEDTSLQCPGPLPPRHRLFTIIDTGSMTVSIFSSDRPPSVALICGKEGGMLRVVLCSYERSTNCLYKESVLRMETPMLDKAELLGWIKVAEYVTKKEGPQF